MDCGKRSSNAQPARASASSNNNNNNHSNSNNYINFIISNTTITKPQTTLC